MKILQIRFQNLNSLAKTWHIDFTDPAYGENSLFAITGPTGAGKSTLLDAICLALYGRTPRLSRITKTSNEIMSRHTGICFAEVEFETVKGKFRCHWSQHRSRQHAGGELQQPKHEIADAAANTILESRIRNVATRVEEVTGMDFDRFTRSTLLAQGGFAAFLQASPDNRAPILEQITGTEIYSRLSIKVHELRTDEQARLQELQQTLEHISLLTPEEEKELQKVVSDREGQGKLLKKETADIRKKMGWLDILAELKAEREEYNRQLQTMAEEEKKHAPKLDLLVPGLAAQEIESVYQKQNTLLASQSKELTEIKEVAAKMDELFRLQKHTGESCQDGQKQLQQAETESKKGQQLIKLVQELDLRLHAAEEQLQEHAEILKTISGQQKEEAAAIQTLEQKLAQEEKKKKELDTFFKQQTGDEKLVEEISALQLEINSLLDLQRQGSTHSRTRKKAEQDVLQKKQSMTLLTKEESSLQAQTAEVGRVLNGLQEEIQQILQGKEAETVQQDLFQSQTRKKTVQDLLLLVEEQAGKKKALDTLRRQILQEAEKEKEINGQLTLNTKEVTGLQQEITLLEKNLLLLARIQKLEAERNRLQDDSPCPLCGATTHPYSQGNIPVPSEEEAGLKEAKTELRGLEKENAQLTHQGIVCSEEQNSLTRRIKEGDEDLSRKQKRTEELLANLELPSLKHVDLQLLKEEEQELVQQIVSLQQNCDRLKQLDRKRAETGKKEKELAQMQQRLEKDLLHAGHQVASAEQETERLLQEERSLFMELEKITTSLFKKLASYGISEPVLTRLPSILEELGTRAEEWKRKKEEETHTAARTLTLSSKLSHKQEYLQKLTAQTADKEEQRRKAKKSLDTLEKNRTALFGNKSTEEEAERLELAVKDARKMLEQWNREYAAIDNKITAARTLQEKLKSDSQQRSQEIEKQEERLGQALKSSPFSDLDEFLTARLQPQELEQLIELQNDLQERRTKLQTLSKDRENALQKEEAKQLCKEEAQELKQKLAELEKQLAEVQGQAGGAQERLKKNSADREEATERLTAIKAQKKVLSRWSRLHMLIGSADGKKFRNFAQGLTFEMMISHANRSLLHMSDRYILVRDKIQPLNLNVIDTFQAGEIRSTRNLSGGESFLVSLSLALGLSRMASQNVRVDSLFLDEGFGTLDEESLETALDTLSQLHEDNKLIGIISHVNALKERIPLQIEIVPGTGGRSSIKGPGVTLENS